MKSLTIFPAVTVLAGSVRHDIAPTSARLRGSALSTAGVNAVVGTFGQDAAPAPPRGAPV